MRGRRVFVTGLGFVSPHGEDPAAIFERICLGESAIRTVRTGTPEMGADVLLASIDFEPGDRIGKADRLLMARAAQLAVVATRNALEDSGLMTHGRGPEEAAVYMGCGLGGAEILQESYRTYSARQSRRVRPTTIPLVMASGPASQVSMSFGIRGPAHTFSIACASSSVAIGEAFRSIRDGYIDVVIAGGAEAMLNDGSVAAWQGLGVLAKEHADGAGASCRPFDLERTGLVLGEGAATLILESENRAMARGADLLVEIVGFGASSDAHKLTEPSVDGQERAIRNALEDAGLTAEDVGYINVHATGTPTGDPVEIEAIKRAFGPAAQAVAISSTKSMHGHLVGASGALECGITALALDKRRIPPTANLTVADPACDLDCVPGVGRDAPDLEVALSNSFAFGGSNATLVLRRA
ncbi:MAG: beta-ketoacyl-[acyl-carrier-protein] synthase family protein [Gemmatimonadetes bacterium]|nr:beta-ketoacyl-[acyl-carrier-protein] synthase family protein [Gemmatimonadota bacterium]